MSGVNWVEEGFGRQNVCRVNGEEFQGRRAEELGCVGCCWLWERMGESSVKAVQEIERNTGGVVREIKWEIRAMDRVLANINANCWHTMSMSLNT